MTFNEKLMGPTVKADIVMPDMDSMKVAATSQLGKDGKSVTLTPKRALMAGKYTVNWSAAGADTHRMTGSFSFTVK